MRICGKCDTDEAMRGQAWCRFCHAAYMRAWRPKQRDMTPEQKRRANCRSYANVYQRRGRLIPQSCEACGDPKVEKHHDDYSKPLQVRWLCRRHHAQLTATRLLSQRISVDIS